MGDKSHPAWREPVTSDGAVAEAGGSLLFRPMLTQQVGNFGVAASSIAVSRSGRAMEAWLRLGVRTTDGGWAGPRRRGRGFAQLTVDAWEDGGVGGGWGFTQLTVAGRDE